MQRSHAFQKGGGKMRHIIIKPSEITINGKALQMPAIAEGSDLLTSLYRQHVNNYPKFFKMDGLSKLGFVASELLLKGEGTERFVDREDRAIILFSRAGSEAIDTKYQQTIADRHNYYPSPSMFVYTLPNIVAGEIAIRNHYYGETSFYLMEKYSHEDISGIVATSFADDTTQSILCGWLDYVDESDFEAFLYILNRNEKT